MKRLLNTIYITTQGSYLYRDGETAVVRVNGETKLQIPIHTIGGIVCFGQMSISSPLMGLCSEHGVAISLLTEHGRFIASIHGPVSGNVLLRREQYRHADNLDMSAAIARSMVVAKIANCRTVLQRAVRDRPESDFASKLSQASEQLAQHIRDLETEASLDTIRGKEGDAARRYFSVFDELITSQKEDFFFHERNRRPPLGQYERTALFHLYVIGARCLCCS